MSELLVGIEDRMGYKTNYIQFVAMFMLKRKRLTITFTKNSLSDRPIPERIRENNKAGNWSVCPTKKDPTKN